MRMVAASNMKIAFKAILVTAIIAISLLGLSLSWFYFYSGDLPDFATLANFAPDSATAVSDRCSKSAIRVIPFAALGKELQSAALAAEGASEEVLAFQISRGLLCDLRMKQLERNLLEYKAAVQLRRRFTRDQLLTIYLNRAYFGNDLIGAESASQHYYRKHASELDVAQAALIAGLIKAPSLYSPEHHPDRAKERRDTVINAMLRDGSITAEQAQEAEHSELR
jgi:penicillin-binding protein 1A